jgi:predicted RNase H-like HicB family nuclease
MHFPVVIHKDPDSSFGVTIPDLPGCFSAGETIEEALDMAKDAILCHIEGLLIDDEAIPAPCSIETYRGHPDYQDGTFALVAIDISQVSGETQRINLTMPKRVLMRLDKYVASVGGNRSAVLTEAALNLTRLGFVPPQ